MFESSKIVETTRTTITKVLQFETETYWGFDVRDSVSCDNHYHQTIGRLSTRSRFTINRISRRKEGLKIN